MNTKFSIYVVIVVALIVGGLSFFGGTKYQQSQRGNGRQFAGGPNASGRGRFGGGSGQGFTPVRGDIIAADDKSITVKLQDGSSKIILFSDSTTINEATQAAKSSLTSGKKVAVFGTQNSDGSVTAQNIQLNPMFGGFRMPNQAQ